MSLFLKLKKAFLEKRFTKTITKKIHPYIKGFLLFFSFKGKNITIHVTKNKKIDSEDIPLAERIFNAYKKIKLDQKDQSDLYKPSSLWQSLIDKDFNFLLESYQSNDIEKFLFFLQNFGNWDKYLGIETQDIIKKYNNNIFLKQFLRKEIFEGQLKLWKFFHKNSNINELDMPMHGNQIGAKINNNFMVIGSFLNHVYAKNLFNLIDQKESKILEIGGGYGRFAYYILKDLKKFSYVDFDIPETLSLASYYLSKCFPNKKNMFYGEKEVNSNNINSHDLIFLPPWEIESLKQDTFDLTLNKNSLGEMEPKTAKNYIKHIHRISKYFFSMNHEYFRNNFTSGEKSLVNKEYNLNKNFTQLMRYPELGHMIYERNKLDYDSNTFFYLYEKNINKA